MMRRLTPLILVMLLAACTVILESPGGWRVYFEPRSLATAPVWATSTPRPTATATVTATVDPTPTQEVWQPTLPPPSGLAARNIPELNQVINVRSCASLDCDIVAKVWPGETVELLLEDPVGGWIHVLVERGLIPGWAVYEWRGEVWWEIVWG